MSAADTTRIGDTYFPNRDAYPVAAATLIDQGTMVFRNSAGNMVPYSLDATLVAVGLAVAKADNSAGAAGDVKVQIRHGVFLLAVLGGDPITIANTQLGAPVFADDAITVRATSAAGTKPAAGLFMGMDPDGTGKAMILLGFTTTTALQAAQSGGGNGTPSKRLITIPVDLASAANAAVLARFKSPCAGKITAVYLAVTKPATTAAKAGAIDFQIATVGITGGQIAATSANQTPLGNRVAGAAITALNTVAVGDEITASWSGVTAFVEGAAVLEIEITPAL